jgi:hypothetical protein
VVAELRALIDKAARGNPKADQPADEAPTIAAHPAGADHEELEELDAAIADRAEDMRGDPVDVEADEEGRPVYVYNPERERRATAFADMAMGRSTPIAHHHPAFLAQSTTKARTKGDDRRAIEFLLKWCGTTSTAATLQSIDRKSAVRFMDWLPSTRQGLSPVTMNKTLSRLGVYWKWLQNRELVDTDPWVRLKLKTLQTPHDELERAFSMEEVRGHVRQCGVIFGCS